MNIVDKLAELPIAIEWQGNKLYLSPKLCLEKQGKNEGFYRVEYVDRAGNVRLVCWLGDAAMAEFGE